MAGGRGGADNLCTMGGVFDVQHSTLHKRCTVFHSLCSKACVAPLEGLLGGCFAVVCVHTPC